MQIIKKSQKALNRLARNLIPYFYASDLRIADHIERDFDELYGDTGAMSVHIRFNLDHSVMLIITHDNFTGEVIMYNQERFLNV